jgi:adenylate cyclase
MTEEKTRRKLIAVVHADVKGYSRLMGEDDEYTVRTLASNRQEMYRLVELHGGQVRDTAGDGFLVEFPSVVDAVKFSVEFQREMKQRNADLPEERKMEFRIGVNIGDVIHDGGTIHGDGVNIAARIESLADPGGICLSGAAYEQVKKRLDLHYDYIGDKSVKNISEPVPTYKVVLEAGEASPSRKKPSRAGQDARKRAYLIVAAVILVIITGMGVWYFRLPSALSPNKIAWEQAPSLPLPDKPSIAVLPFDNMSGDPKQDYFSDGITEEIITGLAKVPKLFVIARNSSFSFKGKAVTVQDVGKKLGVRYVLEGSVRKAEGKVRITAQLIDTQTGGHVWAERYDRSLKDIFAIQDEITRNIMVAMQVKLTQGEQARLRDERGRAESLEAYEKVLRGYEYAHRVDEESNLMAQQLFREAIALDPNYARPYASQAICKVHSVMFGWSKSPAQDFRDAYKLANKAIEINNSEDYAHYALGMVYLALKQHEKAIVEAEKAVEVSPSAADPYLYLAAFLHYAGRPQEALAPANKAIRLNPMPRSSYYWILGAIYRDMNDYDKAIASLKKGIQIDANNLLCRLTLTSTYSLAGRDAQAREEAAELLKRNPKFSLKFFEKKLPYKNAATAKRFIDALRKAGLK